MSRRALTPTEAVTRLAQLPGWQLTGSGAEVAIEKTYTFANYYRTMAFVNAVAFIAHEQDHHPDLSVHYGRCVVRFSTHSAKAITELDFQSASLVDALVA